MRNDRRENRRRGDQQADIGRLGKGKRKVFRQKVKRAAEQGGRDKAKLQGEAFRPVDFWMNCKQRHIRDHIAQKHDVNRRKHTQQDFG